MKHCVNTKHPKPIFLTGTQRSGSTWVAKIITSVPGIIWIDEPFNHRRRSDICGTGFPHWFTHIDEHNEMNYRVSVQNVLSFRYQLLQLLISSRSLGEWRKHVLTYSRFAAHRLRRARPLIKQPTGLFMAEWLNRCFGVHVCIMIRHPAAFVSSRMRLGWGHDFRDFLEQDRLMNTLLAPLQKEIKAFTQEPHDALEQCSFLWAVIYSVVLTYRAKHPEWIYIRHEDLAREPISQFEALFERLGIVFSDDLVTTIREYSHPSNPTDVPVDRWKTTKMNSHDSINNWKNRLSKAEVTRIRHWVEPVASEYYSDREW